MRKFHFKCRPNARTILQVLEGFDTTALCQMFQSWNPGTRGYATFHRVGKLKSGQQLGYYYAVILPMAVDAFRTNDDLSLTLEFGDTKIEVELTLDNMDNFLKVRYAAMTGEYVNKEDMNMAACAAYMDWVIKWSFAWLKITIPEPDTNWKEKK